MKSKIIAIDFDGTCVTHDYPNIGKDIGAIPVLQQLVYYGHRLILFTMRSGQELKEAKNWFDINQIKLEGVNLNPSQATWTTSPKVYADLYIDDAALGCPLKYNGTLSNRPFVDWEKVKVLLQQYMFLPINLNIE